MVARVGSAEAPRWGFSTAVCSTPWATVSATENGVKPCAAKRDAATGKPLGFVPVGNVPELTLDIEISKYEHKESESGNRALDLTLVKEKKGKFKIKMENVSPDNLAMGLYGETAQVVGGNVVGEVIKFYKGKRMPLANPSVSAVRSTLRAAPKESGSPSVTMTTSFRSSLSNTIRCSTHHKAWAKGV